MHNDPNFFLGYCPDQSQNLLALYQPVMDRFLFVIQDLELAKEMIYLASSRYGLYPCDITTADNYHHNILDNTCCQNWTMSNRGLRSLITGYHVSVIKVNQLVEVGAYQDFDVAQEQSWLQMVYLYTRLCKIARQSYPWFEAQQFVRNTLSYRFNCDLDQLVESINQIRRELYLGRDIQSTESNIQDIIKRNPYLHRRYCFEYRNRSHV
jgi:hypothetical protein